MFTSANVELLPPPRQSRGLSEQSRGARRCAPRSSHPSLSSDWGATPLRRAPGAVAGEIETDSGGHPRLPGAGQSHALPKSSEGEAIADTPPNWTVLTRHRDDGDLEIDNNGAECSPRGLAQGGKNWMFYDGDNDARTAATLRSLITTAKRRGLRATLICDRASKETNGARAFMGGERCTLIAQGCWSVS